MRLDNSIPIPGIKKGRTAKCEELYSMETGESFSVSMSRRRGVTNAIQYCMKKTGRQFVTRRDPLDSMKLRIWRVE